jgi:hypothetical protein
MARRSEYRPGSSSYMRQRQAELRRRAALARATAGRAKTSEGRRRAQRRAAAAERGLREIAARQDYRSRLAERDRVEFDHSSLSEQDRLRTMLRDYPDSVPRDLPDPFVGRNRNSLWRLYYSTRAGSRQRAIA